MGALRLRDASATLARLALIIALWTAGEVLSGAPALAVHVSCGDTITTDTTLDSDLTDCPNNGIIIGADDITLDLNGHTIDGDGQLFDPCPEGEFCDAGIRADSHDGVTVINGVVRGFAVGVSVGSARNVHLAGLSSSNNAFFGFLFFDVAHSVLRDSSGSDNPGPDGDGIGVFASRDLRIVGNTFSRNALGFHLSDSTDTLIQQNRFSRNESYAVLTEADGNEIRGNVCRRNTICIGVSRGGSGNVIARNEMRGDVVGIAVEKGRDNLVIRNRVIDPRMNGISLGVAFPPFGGGGNVVRENVVRGSGKDAFKVNKEDHHSVLRQNVARGAREDGFGVRSRTSKLTDDRAIGNGDLGIRAVEGVIDGGGNVARHNGDPRQCVNISCS